MRALIVFSVLGLLACTSEETPTDPSGGPSLARGAAGTYTPVDLGTPGWPSIATAINPAGQIVGSNQSALTFENHATLWDKGVLTDLGTLGGRQSAATAINPAGQVVGSSTLSRDDDETSHAFLWEKGVMADLGTLAGNHSSAAGINPRGQVVGASSTSGSNPHAFLWEHGVMTDLGTLGGTFSAAAGINPAGQVAGTSTTAVVGETHAFLWSNGVMTDLGTLGGTFSFATGIDPKGRVVGTSTTAAGRRHAFVWEQGVMTDLGTLGGAAVTRLRSTRQDRSWAPSSRWHASGMPLSGRTPGSRIWARLAAISARSAGSTMPGKSSARA